MFFEKGYVGGRILEEVFKTSQSMRQWRRKGKWVWSGCLKYQHKDVQFQVSCVAFPLEGNV